MQFCKSYAKPPNCSESAAYMSIIHSINMLNMCIYS